MHPHVGRSLWTSIADLLIRSPPVPLHQTPHGVGSPPAAPARHKLLTLLAPVYLGLDHVQVQKVCAQAGKDGRLQGHGEQALHSLIGRVADSLPHVGSLAVLPYLHGSPLLQDRHAADESGIVRRLP